MPLAWGEDGGVGSGVEFRLLGPFHVLRDGQPVGPAGPKRRGLLAMLVLRANHTVPVEDLIGGLWADNPPPSAANLVQTYVSAWRKTLEPGRAARGGGDRIVTVGPGYRLRTEPGELDLDQFTRAVAGAEAAADAGDHADAADRLAEALGLWRGPPLADLAWLPFHRAAAGLGELRLQAVEAWALAALRCGNARDVLPAVQEAREREPLRERLCELVMWALFQDGRQGEALAAYEQTRRVLAHELGADPGPGLRDMHARVLRHDPALRPPAAPVKGEAVAEPPVTFAGLLRKLRTEARLTQEELADAARLSPRAVSDLERGINRTARKDTAVLLADVLGLAEPVRAVFVAAARGRAPAADVLTAMRGEAAAARGGAMPAEAEGTAPAVVPRQLPAGAAFFAGRETELKELDALLDRAGPNGAGADGKGGADGPSGAVVISAVAGMAGVGKTALAVHWARKVAGRFPDGQLYVNLRGYDAEGAAVTPEEVTGWFLAALGVPAVQIPADAQARCGLYRSALAGRRVLIVLDNARDAAQVRPLLPGSGGCLVVVTSRSSLAGLAAAEGARPLRLGPLSTEEGVRLLAARLGGERVAAELDAVTELAGRCGHLPLALAVMAARAAADPGLPLGALAGQLAGAAGAEAAAAAAGADPGRLEVLETGDPATSLGQLLAWSHRQLSPPAAQMFALLGVHCGPDITVPAAASLAWVPRAEAGRALAELAAASLAAEHRPGRYVLHDLVRVYAAGRARQALGEVEIRAAIERSLDHYLHTRVIVHSIPAAFPVAPPAPGVLPERLAGEAELLAWSQAEHQVVLQAIAAGYLTRAWQLFYAQAWFLGSQDYWADFRTVGQTLLAAAEAAGDQVALGWTHLVIGRCCTLAGNRGEDRAHLARALDHFRRAGDLYGQANAQLHASMACISKAHWAEAAPLAAQALELFRQTGGQTGEGWALASLGACHARLGNYGLARGYARQALEVTPDDRDPVSLAVAWVALGSVHSQLGEPGEAISCYRQALALVREQKNAMARWMKSNLLIECGDAYQAVGDLPAAVEAWQQAQQIRRDMGFPESRRICARLEQADPPSQPG